MDNMSYALESFCQSIWLKDRARPGFRRSEVGTYKAPIAGRPDEINRSYVLGLKRVQDVTADKPGGACDQNFQSGQAEFLANLAKFIERKIDLRVGVRRHQADSN